MFCHKCGKVIPDDSLFCRYCGTNVELKNEEKDVPSPKEEEPQVIDVIPEEQPSSKAESVVVDEVTSVEPSDSVSAEPVKEIPEVKSAVAAAPSEAVQLKEKPAVSSSKESSAPTVENKKQKIKPLALILSAVAVISLVIAIILFIPKSSHKTIKDYDISFLDFFMRDPKPSEAVEYFNGYSRIETDSSGCMICRDNVKFYGNMAELHVRYKYDDKVYDKYNDLNYDASSLDKNNPVLWYYSVVIEKDDVPSGQYDKAIESLLAIMTDKFGTPEKDVNNEEEDDGTRKDTTYHWKYSTARAEYDIWLGIMDWNLTNFKVNEFYVEMKEA